MITKLNGEQLKTLAQTSIRAGNLKYIHINTSPSARGYLYEDIIEELNGNFKDPSGDITFAPIGWRQFKNLPVVALVRYGAGQTLKDCIKKWVGVTIEYPEEEYEITLEYLSNLRFMPEMKVLSEFSGDPNDVYHTHVLSNLRHYEDAKLFEDGSLSCYAYREPIATEVLDGQAFLFAYTTDVFSGWKRHESYLGYMAELKYLKTVLFGEYKNQADFKLSETDSRNQLVLAEVLKNKSLPIEGVLAEWKKSANTTYVPSLSLEEILSNKISAIKDAEDEWITSSSGTRAPPEEKKLTMYKMTRFDLAVPGTFMFFRNLFNCMIVKDQYGKPETILRSKFPNEHEILERIKESCQLYGWVDLAALKATWQGLPELYSAYFDAIFEPLAFSHWVTLTVAGSLEQQTNTCILYAIFLAPHTHKVTHRARRWAAGKHLEFLTALVTWEERKFDLEQLGKLVDMVNNSSNDKRYSFTDKLSLMHSDMQALFVPLLPITPLPYRGFTSHLNYLMVATNKEGCGVFIAPEFVHKQDPLWNPLFGAKTYDSIVLYIYIQKYSYDPAVLKEFGGRLSQS